MLKDRSSCCKNRAIYHLNEFHKLKVLVYNLIFPVSLKMDSFTLQTIKYCVGNGLTEH